MMSGGMLVGLESLLIVGLFYAFCWHQLRVLKREREAREARQARERSAGQSDAAT